MAGAVTAAAALVALSTRPRAASPGRARRRSGRRWPIPALVFMPNAGGALLGMGYRIWHAAASRSRAVALAAGARGAGARAAVGRAGARGGAAGLCRTEWGLAALAAAVLACRAASQGPSGARLGRRAASARRRSSLVFGGESRPLRPRGGLARGGLRRRARPADGTPAGDAALPGRVLRACATGSRESPELVYSAAMWLRALSRARAWLASSRRRTEAPRVAESLARLVLRGARRVGALAAAPAAPSSSAPRPLVCGARRCVRGLCAPARDRSAAVLGGLRLAGTAPLVPPALPHRRLRLRRAAAALRVRLRGRTPAALRRRARAAGARTRLAPRRLRGVVAALARRARSPGGPGHTRRGRARPSRGPAACSRRGPSSRARSRSSQPPCARRTARRRRPRRVSGGRASNLLSGRPNPIRHKLYLPGYLTADERAGVLAELERARPAAIVLWRRPVERVRPRALRRRLRPERSAPGSSANYRPRAVPGCGPPCARTRRFELRVSAGGRRDEADRRRPRGPPCCSVSRRRHGGAVRRFLRHAGAMPSSTSAASGSSRTARPRRPSLPRHRLLVRAAFTPYSESASSASSARASRRLVRRGRRRLARRASPPCGWRSAG